MRKRVMIIVCCVLFVAAVVGGVQLYRWREDQHLRSITTMRELMEDRYTDFGYSSFADYHQYSYHEMLQRAHTIALVTPVDELTVENSEGVSETGDRVYNARSIREVRALAYFKNTRNYGETFELVESCAMLSDGSVVGADEGWYPMQKDEIYLVFLKDTALGYPNTLSADNGKMDLTNLRLNAPERIPLIVEALRDYQLMSPAVWSRTGDDILGLLEDAEILAAASTSSPNDGDEYHQLLASHDWTTVTVESPYTLDSMVLEIAYAETEDGYLYQVGNLIYEATR